MKFTRYEIKSDLHPRAGLIAGLKDFFPWEDESEEAYEASFLTYRIGNDEDECYIPPSDVELMVKNLIELGSNFNPEETFILHYFTEVGLEKTKPILDEMCKLVHKIGHTIVISIIECEDISELEKDFTVVYKDQYQIAILEEY